jgi:uncharacterized protein
VTIVRDVVGFARALRAAGLSVGVDQSASFAQALALLDPLDRHDVYLAARSTLVFRREDLTVFDDVFAAYFDGRPARPQSAPLAPRHDRADFMRTALVAYMAERADPHGPETDVPETAKGASPHEQLQRKDFAACTPAELDALARAMRELRLDVALRASHRFVRARRGHRLDLRRAVRQAARHAGAAFALPHRRRKLKPRPLVVLADISGSMELYTRILLLFLHGLARRHPRTETFVFGTRLTRITSALQLRSVDAALDRATRDVVDMAGGTRIGDALHVFDRAHARRVLGRGAIAMIISDGWETGDLARLDDELRRLAARAHRLVWLNPMLGQAGYEPRVRGMAAALAHVDDFLPIHNLTSLRDLSEHLAAIPRRRGTLLRRTNHERSAP